MPPLLTRTGGHRRRLYLSACVRCIGRPGSMPATTGIGGHREERRPGRHPDGTQRLLLTVASSRTWRGSKDSAAPDLPGRPRRGYPTRGGPSIITRQLCRPGARCQRQFWSAGFVDGVVGASPQLLQLRLACGRRWSPRNLLRRGYVGGAFFSSRNKRHRGCGVGWRRGWDLNPRSLSAHALSRRAR